MGKAFLQSIFVLAFAVAAANAQIAPANLENRLADADRLAWLTNWYDALPIYAEVEQAATKNGDRRAAMYAKFGRLRGEMQVRSLADISEQIATDLESPIAKSDARVRLRGLTIKGDIDLEWNVQAAGRVWQEVRQLARELGDKGWENRANGELGIVAFLNGNTGQATKLVQQALQGATEAGDIGGQLRYMGTIAAGLVLAGYTPIASGYLERALKLADERPEVGFPFAIYSTKVLMLLAQDQADEAERFAKAAMAEARTGDRRIKEIELLVLLARIEEKRGRRDQAIAYLNRAVNTARAGSVQRLLADAESFLADAYRARGNLAEARRHAMSAVAETQAGGTIFSLPARLKVLAEILVSQGRTADATRVYQQAADVIEAIMVNVPSREAQARLIGARSGVYEGHFRLVADNLRDPAKAYEVIERARGRAVADVLRELPNDEPVATSTEAAAFRAISRLQIRLMRAQSQSERQQLLEQLWEAEQRARARGPGAPVTRLTAGSPVPVRTLQQHLAPVEIILQYVLTEPHSYCLLIGRNQLRLVQLPPSQHIEPLVDQFVRAVRESDETNVKIAHDLHDALLQPIGALQTAKRVFVVPDGKLHLLPFDVILSRHGGAGRIVSSVPSANVLYLLRTRQQQVAANRPLFAMGGVPYDRMFEGKSASSSHTRSGETRGFFDAAFRSSLPNLPTARVEVLTAAKLLGSGSVALTGEEATETRLKREDLQAFGILHFAAHAFADPKFPERAAVVLLNDPANGEDGLLQPREIGQLRLNAGAVVLSACDTAVGATLGQEGVLNIARAFLLVGARSVVTTLWAVSDESSTALMRRFYENIANGQDVAEALMGAKSAMLSQFGPNVLSSVAAFQIVGVGDYRLAPELTRARTNGNSSR